MVSCIIHVFGVLAEYALILKIIQAEKRRDAKVNFINLSRVLFSKLGKFAFNIAV